jgi:23S rRNA pseudouridine2605 synthase
MENNKGKNSKGKPSFNKNKKYAKPAGGLNRTAAKPKVKVAPSKPQQPQQPKDPNSIRLNKYLANAGVCARREADIYIQSGNVKVNGKVVAEVGSIIKLTDEVHFDGALIYPGKKEYILLNKPKNFTTSTDDSNTNRNVLGLVAGASSSALRPVGRMDKNSMGLLLFTNDTDMITKFAAPKQKTIKIYQVSLDKNLKYEDLEKIKSGLVIEKHRIFVDDVSYVENEPKCEIGITMKTPNIKVIRTIFEHLNYDVLRIDRVVFAGLTKKNLPRGNWRPLTSQEIVNLKNS